MLLSFSLTFIFLAVSAFPCSPCSNGLVDIRVAAASAAYAVHDNSAFGSATDLHNVTGYVDTYDSDKSHIGRYPASEFFAASPSPTLGVNCGPLTIGQLSVLPGNTRMQAAIKRDVEGNYWNQKTTNPARRFCPHDSSVT
ncbi:hypothetical protein B0H17DRAFT_1146138 [Mycena rosella]|uniref:Uncharacterized protein n=1 Tax=Mycena rosella TaxID=1033263 RepID=A0AAD7G3R6_MYCRO|nr:hypothetical protein B0H17DRAFT_1146138 [Mycena rosella]